MLGVGAEKKVDVSTRDEQNSSNLKSWNRDLKVSSKALSICDNKTSEQHQRSTGKEVNCHSK